MFIFIVTPNSACSTEPTASTPLISRAAELEMPALALTDHGVMYGTADFYGKCKDEGVKPILGVEAYVAPRGTPR